MCNNKNKKNNTNNSDNSLTSRRTDGGKNAPMLMVWMEYIPIELSSPEGIRLMANYEPLGNFLSTCKAAF